MSGTATVGVPTLSPSLSLLWYRRIRFILDAGRSRCSSRDTGYDSSRVSSPVLVRPTVELVHRDSRAGYDSDAALRASPAVRRSTETDSGPDGARDPTVPLSAPPPAVARRSGVIRSSEGDARPVDAFAVAHRRLTTSVPARTLARLPPTGRPVVDHDPRWTTTRMAAVDAVFARAVESRVGVTLRFGYSLFPS